MFQRPADATPLDLLTPAEMGQVDALAAPIPGQSEALMEAAGRAVARAVRRRFRPCRTVVLAGPGNNGGDGYVAARLLQQWGWPVTVLALAPPRAGSDAALMAARWKGPQHPCTPANLARAELVIDALFGAGLARPLAPAVAELLAGVKVPLVAVDTPSGLDGATGAALGFAPQAALTVTFFRLKPGHLLFPGRALCGQVVLADIGMPPDLVPVVAPAAVLNRPGPSWRGPGWTLPQPGWASQKHNRGHVAILGSSSMTGAARLAAAGARHGGAGLATIVTGAEAAPLYRVAEPGVLVSDSPLAELLANPRLIWLAGPGLPPDEDTRAAVAALLAEAQGGQRHVVLDAGALTAHAGHPEALQGAAVLTPHSGEFTRLFGSIGEDRLAAVRAAARRSGAVVVLKGADSVIGAPDGRVAINADAPPWLATGGTGDVLAGLIASLLSQGMAPFEAACAGVWQHGMAALAAGPGLVAEALPAALPQVSAAMK